MCNHIQEETPSPLATKNALKASPTYYFLQILQGRKKNVLFCDYLLTYVNLHISIYRNRATASIQNKIFLPSDYLPHKKHIKNVF